MERMFKKFLHGGDYNPEQWKHMPEILKQDTELMKKANCNTMTVGVFNWAEIEKNEDEFDFSFTDSVISEISKNGGNVILATPTAGIPMWLREKYPDALKVNAEGNRVMHGRMNFCYTSPDFLRRVKILNTKLAEHYKNNSAVILYHISNEFGAPCYCGRCIKKFQNWLKEKYKTLDELNKKQWNAFWSGTYQAWEQIDPRAFQNTSLFIEWKRFHTENIRNYIKFEADILRKITPEIPITTNHMPFFGEINYNRLNDILDVISFDSYPLWHLKDMTETAVLTGFTHDCFRSMKKKPYILMESTPSSQSWVMPVCKNKRPGVHILSSLQAISHGSESVLYFQWRKGRGGMEKYHGAVVGHDGTSETRVFKEVAQLGEILEKINETGGGNVKSEVAFIYDWENSWTLERHWGDHNDGKKYLETCTAHYKPFWQMGINADVIDCEKELTDYKLVIAPMLDMISDKMAEKIEKYVENGGTFVMTYMSGYCDEYNLCRLGGYPCGKLKDVFGVYIGETEILAENENNSVDYLGKHYKAIDYCDIIRPYGAEILGEYTQDFYSGVPAVCQNRYGKGNAYYIGFRDNGDFLSDFYGRLSQKLSLERSLSTDLPDGVTAHTRENENGKYVFVQNFNEYETELYIFGEYTDILTNKKISGITKMEPYETKILKK